MFGKSVFGAIMVGGFALASGTAHATTMTFTSDSAYISTASSNSIGTSDPVDWGTFSQAQGNSTINGSTFASGSSMTTSGQNESVTTANGSSGAFTVYVNGLTTGLPATRWDGDFANGAHVLFTASTTITLTFNGNISGIGLDAETSAAGSESFALQAYDSSGTLLGEVTNSGTSTGRASSSFNTAPFLGVISTNDNIASVVITTTGSNSGSGFAIDTAQIYDSVAASDSGGGSNVPEPGTLTALGVGLAGLGMVRRRRGRSR